MSSIEKDVEKQLNRWFSALKTGDSAKVTELYSKDAILLSTLKGDVKQGHRKIRGYFERNFLPKQPIGKAEEPYTRLLGGIAVNSGLYSFKINGEGKKRVTVQARYTFVYQWQDNDWKIVEHHSSLNPEA